MKSLNRRQMAWRASLDIPPNSFVNLGIGAPELVAEFTSSDRNITFHTENGFIGMGPSPKVDEEDHELINAGKKPVTLLPGGCFFHHADSFTMIRGGHIDVCIMGAYEVSQTGDLANWSTGLDDSIPAIGGAMDLAQGAKQVFVLMNHCDRQGNPKILSECSLPLTGKGVVSIIFTDLAVMHVTPHGLLVTDIVEGLTREELQAKTGANLQFDENPKIINPPQ